MNVRRRSSRRARWRRRSRMPGESSSGRRRLRGACLLRCQRRFDRRGTGHMPGDLDLAALVPGHEGRLRCDYTSVGLDRLAHRYRRRPLSPARHHRERRAPGVTEIGRLRHGDDPLVVPSEVEPRALETASTPPSTSPWRPWSVRSGSRRDQDRSRTPCAADRPTLNFQPRTRTRN